MNGRTKYQLFLFIAFLAAWILAAVHPLYRDGWLLENLLVFIFVPLLLVFSYFFRLSNVSYTLITIFIILHVIGSHYTYAEVPFGYVLQQWFGSDRNMYDRLVHFSFGFLLAYPIREIFMRVTNAKGIWGYYLPIELTLAFSAIYEIIEWLAAVIVDPHAGLAFLGSQGDIWDAQKDMLVAGIGAVVSMIVVLITNSIFKKDFAKDFADGFKMKKQPLGEVKLAQMLKQR
jgi:putative membrane protein